MLILKGRVYLCNGTGFLLFFFGFAGFFVYIYYMWCVCEDNGNDDIDGDDNDFGGRMEYLFYLLRFISVGPKYLIIGFECDGSIFNAKRVSGERKGEERGGGERGGGHLTAIDFVCKGYG